MNRIFVGVDHRQPIAFSVLASSIVWNAKSPFSITPLRLPTLPIKRKGLTEFTFARFLVPWLCGYEGTAVFMDSDVLVTGDISELFKCADSQYDLQVMQEQPKFEWPSVMLFNCANCKTLTPEYVDDEANVLYDLKWAKSVGNLPEEWNHCCGYQEPKDAKLYHFTMGVPCWPETRGNCPEDDLWLKAYRHAGSSVPWKSLMGNSVHAKRTMEAFKARSEIECL